MRRGIDHPQARWLILFQAALGVVLTVPVLLSGSDGYGLGFGLGALLSSVNFFFLAKLVLQLIQPGNGSVLALLVSFYARLLGTGVVLFLAIVPAGLPPVAILAGLSSLLMTFAVWTGKYIVTQQHKEA